MSTTAQDLVPLVVVPAYYLDRSSGTVVEAEPQNRVLAQQFAEKWNAWRRLVRDSYGWELLISGPANGAVGYTRAMFRTPEDQASMDASSPDTAAFVDRSPHQAGHAVDISLVDMQATYANYDYNALVQAAEQVGIYARLRNANPPEPWHFDDDPRSIYGGDITAAVDAIGNTSTQVQAALAAGVERPEEIAIRRWQLQKMLGVGAAVAVAVLVALALKESAGASKEQQTEHRQPDTAPTFKGAVYA